MNIFTAVGTILSSVTNVIVTFCQTGETIARTCNEAAGIAEKAVMVMAAEQQAELDKLAAANPPM
jgi:hypothetical protein